MKITMYELLGMIKDGKELPKLENKAEENFEYYVYDKWGETCNLKDLKDLLNDEVKILKEEKKIPEKIPYYSLEKIQKAKNKDEWREERISLLEKRVNDLHIKINEILDYLKSKGDE